MQTICSFMTTPKTEEGTGSLPVLRERNLDRGQIFAQALEREPTRRGSRQRGRGARFSASGRFSSRQRRR